MCCTVTHFTQKSLCLSRSSNRQHNTSSVWLFVWDRGRQLLNASFGSFISFLTVRLHVTSPELLKTVPWKCVFLVFAENSWVIPFLFKICQHQQTLCINTFMNPSALSSTTYWMSSETNLGTYMCQTRRGVFYAQFTSVKVFLSGLNKMNESKWTVTLCIPLPELLRIKC